MSLDSTPVSSPKKGSSGSLRYLLGAVAAVALLAGAVFGLTWSGGGKWAEATPGAGPQKLVATGPAATTTIGSLPAFQGGTPQSMADLVEHVLPTVVTVKVKVSEKASKNLDEALKNSPFRDFFEQFQDRRNPQRRPPVRRSEVQGSGFVIDETGYIVTNNHVIDDSTEIEVTLADEKDYKAKLVGRDEATDIALIKIEPKGKLETVSFADDTKVRVGDWVLAVGNPFGLGGTVTAGIVSARGRDIGSGPYTDYLQIDASINRGNSGGPTFDMKGQVVGMNTAIFSPSGGSVGIGFAIPASTIQSVVADLRKTGEVARGWLGVQIQTVNEDIAQSLGLKDAKGAFVASVVKGSPADKAGFKEGDVVIAVDGISIETNRDMTRKVATLADGATASFTVIRDGKQTTLRAKVGKREAEKKVSELLDRDGGAGAKAKIADLGLELAEITQELRDEYRIEKGVNGLVIVDIEPDSDAAEKGIRAGERIVGIGQEKIETIAGLEAGIDRATKAGRNSVLLKVEGPRGARYVPVKLGNAE
jgi:serine protease Do